MTDLAREYVDNVYLARELGYSKDQMRDYLRTLDGWLRAATTGHAEFCRVLSDAYQIIEQEAQDAD